MFSRLLLLTHVEERMRTLKVMSESQVNNAQSIGAIMKDTFAIEGSKERYLELEKLKTLIENAEFDV